MFKIKGFYPKGEEWVTVTTARAAVDEQRVMFADGCHTVTIEWVELELRWTAHRNRPIAVRDITVATP